MLPCELSPLRFALSRYRLPRKVSLCVFVLLIGVVLTSWGQSPPDQVLLPLLVVDHHGDPVSDLTSESLMVSDNKVLVTSTVTVLRGRNIPLRLGILIDTSGSQRGDAHEAAVNGMKDFANDALRGDQDRVFFELFSDTVKATPFLTKAQLSGVSLPLQVGRGTALYEAIALACTDRVGKSDWRSPVQQVLLIVSDGEDNASRITRAKAEDILLSSGVVLLPSALMVPWRIRWETVS